MNLSNIPLSLKALFTGYILVIGVGLMMAGVQIMLTHGQSDGKPGLSIDDVIYSYYGNRSNSKLENKLNGSMKDKAPVKERLKIINWVKHGAEQQRWKNEIQPIVLKRCASCHTSIPALPNITKFEVIKGLSATEGAVDISSLTRISHIHLFGIAFIFFFVGLIFSLSVGFNKGIKAIIIFIPFAFLILDVSAWWLTRIDPAFAWLVIIGGFGYSLASAIMLSTSLYQMWVMPWRQSKNNNTQTWFDE